MGPDQPPRALNLAALLPTPPPRWAASRQTRQQVRDALATPTRARVTALAPVIRAALDPREAYNDIPGARSTRSVKRR
jgi:hypothetical protein